MSAEALQEDEIPVQRRAAAKKATKLAAQQLDSSPIRSGGEIDPTTFGEPSRSKVVVKKTYGGKVRGKFSPLKQTPESSEPSSSRVVRKSKSVPQLNSPTPSRRRKPPPSSSIPTSPAKSYKGKRKAITPTPTLSDDSEIEMLLPLPTVPARPKNKSPAKPAPTTNGKNSIQKTTKRGRKRPLSPQPSGPQSPASDASSLTPLSSPEPDEISLLCGPPASRDFTRSLTSRTIQSTSDVEETWDLNTLGSYVWVSMDTSGELSESNDDTLWWPAKVFQSLS